MSERLGSDTHDSLLRDPDPLSVVLATLGAVGSIASIVSLAQSRRRNAQMDERLHRQDRGDLVEHLASAEASLAELSSVVARMKLMAQVFPERAGIDELGERSDDRAVEFGQSGLMLPRSALDEFFKLQDRAFRHSKASQKALSSVFKVLYRTESGVPEEHFHRFVQVIRKVNAVLSERTDPVEILQRTEDVTTELGAAIHSLRVFIAGGPDAAPSREPRFL